MNSIVIFILSALQITLLDIVLSGDNVGVIALAIKNLNSKDAKLASLIGVSGAVFLRIFFASIITLIMALNWLPIRLIGGLLLLKITWHLINTEYDTDECCSTKASNTFWKAVGSMILADASMSLDNVLAIGGAANGNVGLIAFGVFLNIPIIFLGSQYVAALMKKYKITIYIGGAILVHTSLAMILEDNLVTPYIHHLLIVILPWTASFLTLVYGITKIKKFSNKTKLQVKIRTQNKQDKTPA